jgi:hypothetical protein
MDELEQAVLKAAATKDDTATSSSLSPQHRTCQAAVYSLPNSCYNEMYLTIVPLASTVNCYKVRASTQPGGLLESSTPAKHIAGIITEKGMISPKHTSNGMAKVPWMWQPLCK